MKKATKQAIKKLNQAIKLLQKVEDSHGNEMDGQPCECAMDSAMSALEQLESEDE